MWLTKINKPAKPSHLGMIHIYLQLWPFTVKGQSRSDSLLLSPYHWAKLFRGVVAIVAVPMRFAVICWIVFRGFCGSNPCISVGFLDDHTSARFKSYQFLKVVSGGRAPGKSSSFASSQILVIERFHCFRGSFGGSFGCIFSTCFHLCSLFVPFFFIFLSFFLTDCYFFSFHCFLRSLSLTPSQIKPLWQNDCL